MLLIANIFKGHLYWTTDFWQGVLVRSFGNLWTKYIKALKKSLISQPLDRFPFTVQTTGQRVFCIPLKLKRNLFAILDRKHCIYIGVWQHNALETSQSVDMWGVWRMFGSFPWGFPPENIFTKSFVPVNILQWVQFLWLYLLVCIKGLWCVLFTETFRKYFLVRGTFFLLIVTCIWFHNVLSTQ